MVIKSGLLTDVNVQVSQTRNIVTDLQCSSDACWQFPRAATGTLDWLGPHQTLLSRIITP